MSLIDVWIKVKDTNGRIGNRWQNRETTLILKPSVPPTMGNWDSRRQIDIDSSANTVHATYIWDLNIMMLYVQTSGFEGNTPTQTPLVLYNFNKINVGERGTGIFSFRPNENHLVSWTITPSTYRRNIVDINPDASIK